MPLGVSSIVRSQGGRRLSCEFKPYRGAVRDVKAGRRDFEQRGPEGFDRLRYWGRGDRDRAYRYGFELARREARA